MEAIISKLPKHSNEVNRCWTKNSGQNHKFVRTFNPSLPYQVLKKWLDATSYYGKTFVGRVDDCIVCTFIPNCTETQHPPNRKRSREQDDEHVDDAKHSKQSDSDSKRPYQMFRKWLSGRPKKNVVDDRNDAMVRAMCERVCGKNAIPSDKEIVDAAMIVKRASRVFDGERSVHTQVELSINDPDLSHNMLRCPRIIIMVRIPCSISVESHWLQEILNDKDGNQSAADAILTCEENPLIHICNKTPQSAMFEPCKNIGTTDASKEEHLPVDPSHITKYLTVVLSVPCQ